MGTWEEAPLTSAGEAMEAVEKLLGRLFDALGPGADIDDVRAALGEASEDDVDEETGGDLVYTREIGDGGELAATFTGGGTEPVTSARIEARIDEEDWADAWRGGCEALAARLEARFGPPREDGREDDEDAPTLAWVDGPRFERLEVAWSEDELSVTLEGVPAPEGSLWVPIMGFEGLEAFLVRALCGERFTCFGARPGADFDALVAALGPPRSEDDQEVQRTMTWRALLDHAEEGRRDDHIAELTAVGYHGEPVSELALRLTYFGTGDYGPPWDALVKGLRAQLKATYGAPAPDPDDGVKGWRDDALAARLVLKARAGDLAITLASTA